MFHKSLEEKGVQPKKLQTFHATHYITVREAVYSYYFNIPCLNFDLLDRKENANMFCCFHFGGL